MAVPGHSVLIIDDFPLIGRILTRAFSIAEITSYVATNLEEAMAILKERGDEIGAVLLEMRVDGIRSSVIVKKIRELQPAVPICLMTGSFDEDKQQALLDCDPLAVFKKPFRLFEVVTIVTDLLNGKEQEHV